MGTSLNFHAQASNAIREKIRSGCYPGRLKVGQPARLDRWGRALLCAQNSINNVSLLRPSFLSAVLDFTSRYTRCCHNESHFRLLEDQAGPDHTPWPRQKAIGPPRPSPPLDISPRMDYRRGYNDGLAGAVTMRSKPHFAPGHAPTLLLRNATIWPFLPRHRQKSPMNISQQIP